MFADNERPRAPAVQFAKPLQATTMMAREHGSSPRGAATREKAGAAARLSVAPLILSGGATEATETAWPWELR
jgi:hypothetical protein